MEYSITNYLPAVQHKGKFLDIVANVLTSDSLRRDFNRKKADRKGLIFVDFSIDQDKLQTIASSKFPILGFYSLEIEGLYGLVSFAPRLFRTAPVNRVDILTEF